VKDRAALKWFGVFLLGCAVVVTPLWLKAHAFLHENGQPILVAIINALFGR